jgi:ribosome-binding factor A
MRIQRIAGRVREEMSELLVYQIQDPRLLGVTVTDVQIDRELAFADIYVSAVEGSERAKDVVDALQHAGSFIRHYLAEKVQLRSFPKLRFYWDPTPERADRIEQLFAQLHQEEKPAAEIDVETEGDIQDEE